MVHNRNYFSRTNRAFVASLAAGCLMGGGCLLPSKVSAQEFEDEGPIGATPCPNDLKTGLNLPQTWGGMEFWWAQTVPAIGTPRFPHIYTATGIEQILNPDTSTAYLEATDNRFGHVRFLLDPLVAGNVANGVYQYPDADNISPSMQAFLDDVQLCVDSGLPVVVNLFPYWISQRHYDYIVKGTASSLPPFSIPQPDGSTNSTNNGAWAIASPDSIKPFFQSPRQYPGPWRKDFSFQFASGPISNNHPLVKSWRELTKMFAARFKPGQVYYQMMSEAQVGLTEPNYLTATERATLLPTESPGTSPIYRERRWRDIQLKAIQAIQEVDSSARIIATSNESFPFSFVKPSTSPNAVGGYESTFNKYSSSEILDASKIIYAFHMYAPFRFTHPGGVAWDNPLWRYHNPSALDSLGNPVESYSYLPPETGTAPNATRNDFSAVIGTFSPHQSASSLYHATRMKQQFDLMGLWRNLEWPGAGSVSTTLGNPPVTVTVPNSIPIMMTEFGAEQASVGNTRLYGVTFHSQQLEGYVGPGEGVPTPQNDERELMRARWIYDARKLGEHQQYGWCFFATHGSFGAFTGQLFKSGVPEEQNPIQPIDFLNSQFRDSLLANTRPMP